MTYARPMPADAPHGSLSTYVNYGCRCRRCKDARAAHQRDYYARRKLRKKAGPTDNGVLAALRPPGGWWRDPKETT